MTSTQKKPEDRTITIPLKLYISQLLGDLTCRNIDFQTAELISLLDTEELFCHVQFDSVVYDTIGYDHKLYTLDSPILWNIQQWRKSSTRYQRVKAETERQKLEDWLLSENILLVAKALSKLTNVDIDIMKVSARKMITSNNVEAFNQLGIKLLTELPK